MTHMKRLVAPATWPIQRKEHTFVTRPLPSGTKFKYGLTLSFILKEVLKVCKINKEMKYLIANKLVKVNGKLVKDMKVLVGLFQVINIKGVNFRVVLTKSGKLNVIQLKEENPILISKVTDKRKNKKSGIQISMFDGKNFIVDEEKAKLIKVGDSLILKDKDFDIISLEKNSNVMLYDGRHRGCVGKITSLDNEHAIIDTNGDSIKTLTKYCYVLSKPKDKISIQLE